MRIGEFMRKANVSNKTAIWLYDHVFSKDSPKGSAHRNFTDENVDWVKSR